MPGPTSCRAAKKYFVYYIGTEKLRLSSWSTSYTALWHTCAEKLRLSSWSCQSVYAVHCTCTEKSRFRAKAAKTCKPIRTDTRVEGYKGSPRVFFSTAHVQVSISHHATRVWHLFVWVLFSHFDRSLAKWLWVKTNGIPFWGILVYFSGDWDVYWGTIWLLTHGSKSQRSSLLSAGTQR